jgi:L-threonylcarbamoyladenylate synthase
MDAGMLADISPIMRSVMERFWPGPLTLVLPRREGCPLAHGLSAGHPTIALRMPAHPLAQTLLTLTGRPIAAPSANRSGHISPTEAAHVQQSLAGEDVWVLDGGRCKEGVESTILSLSARGELIILRAGSIAAEAIADVVGYLPKLAKLHLAEGDQAPAPGLLASHYAPRLPVRLNALSAREGEALLGFGPECPKGVAFNLSPSGNVEEAAHHLFAALYALDRPGDWVGIAVMPIPNHGVGVAINDRLQRAAAPRDYI